MTFLIVLGCLFAVMMLVIVLIAQGRSDNLQKHVTEIIENEFKENIESNRLVYNNVECFWHYIKGTDKFGFVSIDTKAIFPYSDIAYLAIDIDGATEVSKTKTSGAITGAVAGGLLFGGIGAIVGSNANKKHTTNTTKTHNVTISVGLRDSTFINIHLPDVLNHVLPNVRECYNFLAAKHALNDLSEGIAGIESQGDTKLCPFCAETIKRAAIVCRYCSKELPSLQA